MLDVLPPVTASCFFLGLIAAMYLEPDANGLKLLPASPVAQRLFSFQSANWAALPITVLKRQAKRAERRPLYLPDEAQPDILVRMETDTDLLAPAVLLSSL
jgi:hypothetical protein